MTRHPRERTSKHPASILKNGRRTVSNHFLSLHQCYHLLFEFRSNMADENGPLQYRKLPTDCKRQIIIHYTLGLSLATFSPPLLVLSSCGGVLHGDSHHAIVCSSTGIAYRATPQTTNVR